MLMWVSPFKERYGTGPGRVGSGRVGSGREYSYFADFDHQNGFTGIAATGAVLSYDQLTYMK